MPDFKINDEYSPFAAIELTKQVVKKTKELTDTKSKDAKAADTLAAVKEKHKNILKYLGYNENVFEDEEQSIQKRVAAHKEKKKNAKQEIKADDEEKLALAETLAAIAQVLMANWSSKSASEKQAALDQIAALKAQIGDISIIASDEIKEELEGIAAGVDDELKNLAEDTDEFEVASSAMEDDEDNDYNSSMGSITDENKVTPLDKPDAQYTLYSDTTGVRMGVRVKDGKTKIRIPLTEGLTQDEKVKLAKSFVEAALLEGAYKLENGVPTFTLTTQDPQFREAVKAQIELLGYTCKLPKGHEIPEGKITKEVRKYNEEVLSEHMPAHTFTDEKEKKKYLANRPATDFQFALFNSLVTPKTEKRAEADLKAAAPSSLFKYVYHNRAEAGALRVAKLRSGSLTNPVPPADIAEAAESVKQGFATSNYPGTIERLNQELLNSLKSFGVNDEIIKQLQKELDQDSKDNKIKRLTVDDLKRDFKIDKTDIKINDAVIKAVQERQERPVTLDQLARFGIDKANAVSKKPRQAPTQG